MGSLFAGCTTKEGRKDEKKKKERTKEGKNKKEHDLKGRNNNTASNTSPLRIQEEKQKVEETLAPRDITAKPFKHNKRCTAWMSCQSKGVTAVGGRGSSLIPCNEAKSQWERAGAVNRPTGRWFISQGKG